MELLDYNIEFIQKEVDIPSSYKSCCNNVLKIQKKVGYKNKFVLNKSKKTNFCFRSEQFSAPIHIQMPHFLQLLY